MVSKKELLDKLTKGVMIVSFVNSDGTNRILRCTLESSYLPKKELLAEYIGTGDPDAIRVWDIEARSWKILNFNKVTNVQDIY